jgi:hypothetical protein
MDVAAHKMSFAELQEQGQSHLVDFLSTDLDLGFTLCGMLGNTPTEAHQRQLTKDTKAVLDTVRRFAPRLMDSAARADLEKRAKSLEDHLARTLK